jgi:hypothetical protein
MIVGKITGREIRKNRDGSRDVILLQVVVNDPQDVQTVQLMSQAGEKHYPRSGDEVVIDEVGKSWKMGMAVDDRIGPDGSSEDGDWEAYSYNASGRLGRLQLNQDGELVIHDGTNHAVQYEALKKEFDSLQKTVNDLIFAYNSHIHITTATVGAGPTPGVISPTVSTGTTSTADITNVEIDEILVP